MGTKYNWKLVVDLLQTGVEYPLAFGFVSSCLKVGTRALFLFYA